MVNVTVDDLAANSVPEETADPSHARQRPPAVLPFAHRQVRENDHQQRWFTGQHVDRRAHPVERLRKLFLDQVDRAEWHQSKTRAGREKEFANGGYQDGGWRARWRGLVGGVVRVGDQDDVVPTIRLVGRGCVRAGGWRDSFGDWRWAAAGPNSVTGRCVGGFGLARLVHQNSISRAELENPVHVSQVVTGHEGRFTRRESALTRQNPVCALTSGSIDGVRFGCARALVS